MEKTTLSNADALRARIRKALGLPTKSQPALMPMGAMVVRFTGEKLPHVGAAVERALNSILDAARDIKVVRAKEPVGQDTLPKVHRQNLLWKGKGLS